jgi:hypothetical protein
MISSTNYLKLTYFIPKGHKKHNLIMCLTLIEVLK